MYAYISSLNNDIYWRNMSQKTLQNEYIFNFTLERITFVNVITNVGIHIIGIKCKQCEYRNNTYERQIPDIWLVVKYFKRRYLNHINTNT